MFFAFDMRLLYTHTSNKLHTIFYFSSCFFFFLYLLGRAFEMRSLFHSFTKSISSFHSVFIYVAAIVKPLTDESIGQPKAGSCQKKKIYIYMHFVCSTKSAKLCYSIYIYLYFFKPRTEQMSFSPICICRFRC